MNLNQLSWVIILSSLLTNAGYAKISDSKPMDQETARQVILALTKTRAIEQNSSSLLMELLNGRIAFENLSQKDLQLLDSEIKDTAKRMTLAGSIL